jgi:acyl dehydratase
VNGVLAIGQTATLSRAIAREDVAAYVALGGAPCAAGAVPEPLLDALFSCLLGTRLPGPGTNYLKQESRYRQPAHIDDPITARVTVTRLRPDKHLVDLRTTCHDSAGNLLCDGRALVYVLDVRGAGD